LTLVTTACTQKEEKSVWAETISSRKLLHYNSYTRVARFEVCVVILTPVSFD